MVKGKKSGFISDRLSRDISIEKGQKRKYEFNLFSS